MKRGVDKWFDRSVGYAEMTFREHGGRTVSMSWFMVVIVRADRWVRAHY